LRSTLRWFVVTAVLASALAAGQADAARELPKAARFGTLSDFRYPYAKVDQRTLRLAPGCKIRNQQNLLITPAAMPPRGSVLYQLDTRGEISGLWLLTGEEAARYRRPPPPAGTGRD
jgi:hypothetical protein